LKTESVRDPRFSSDFENLCWLQNQAKGPHFQSSQLIIVTTFFLFLIMIRSFSRSHNLDEMVK